MFYINICWYATMWERSPCSQCNTLKLDWNLLMITCWKTLLSLCNGPDPTLELLYVYFWTGRVFHIFRGPIINSLLKQTRNDMCSTHSSRKNDSGRNNFNLEGTCHIMAVLSRYKVLTTTVHLRRFYHTRTSGDNNCKQSQRKMWTSGYRTPGDRASFMNLLSFLYYVWAFHLQITSSYVSFFNFKSKEN